LGAVRELSHGFALAVPHPEVLRIRDDAAFFQAVQAVLGKHVRPQEELDHAVRQIFSRAVAAVGITSDGLRREALRRKGVIPDDAIEFGVVARRLHFEPNWTLGSRSRQ
jgi:Domain of unknown function (DUF3387)